jgi:hypothetical protein
MRRALGTLQSDGPIPVMVFNVPCFDWVQQPTDGEEHNAKRLRTVNRAMKQVAAEFPTVQVVDYSRFVCRGKGGTELIPGVRPDGAHPTVPTVARVWNWLKPQILTAVRKER